MELSIRPSATAPISCTGSGEKIGQRVKDNSTQMTLGGGAGVATFGTLSQSSKIGNHLVKAVKASKAIKAEKQAQLLSLLEKTGKFAKFATNPVVRKIAGGLAGLSAATTLVGSAAKIADTYGYLSAQNPQA